MKSQLVRVVLNPNREQDKRILDYLLYAGEPMSKAFKTAMLWFIDGRNGNFNHEMLLQELRKVLREELRQFQPSDPACFSQSALQSPNEDEVSPLDFLDQLEAMGNN